MADLQWIAWVRQQAFADPVRSVAHRISGDGVALCGARAPERMHVEVMIGDAALEAARPCLICTSVEAQTAVAA